MPHRSQALILAAAFTLTAGAQTARETLFTNMDRFEHNATKVTRVENDDHHSHSSDPNEPHLSTVYVFKYDKLGLYNAADVESLRQKIHTSGWTCRSCPESGAATASGKLTLACTRPAGPSSEESAVIVQKPEELTFVHSIGHHSSSDHTTCSEDN